MSRKGQKYNKYSYELRIEIVNKYLTNQNGLTGLSVEYNIPIKTIDNWIYQYKHKNNDLTNKRKGRIRKDVEIDYKERYEIIKKYQTFLKAQREKK